MNYRLKKFKTINESYPGEIYSIYRISICKNFRGYIELIIGEFYWI